MSRTATSTPSPTVAIFGGGIGGLTVAHLLSQRGYQCTIYESKSALGGLARSQRNDMGCTMEVCWRVFFGFYDNLFRLVRQIPLRHDSRQTVMNHFVPYRHINFEDLPLSTLDWLRSMYTIAYGLTSSTPRLESMDHLSWHDALPTTSQNTVFHQIGTWLGMDRYKGSYHSVMRVGMEMQMVPATVSSEYTDYITSQPTSEAWFDEWEAHLKNQGVVIHKQTALTELVFNLDDTIHHAVVTHHHHREDIVADEYILAIPVDVLAHLVSKNDVLRTKSCFQHMFELAAMSLHEQVAIEVYFDRKISLGDRNAFLVVDAPWDLIVLSYDQAYQHHVPLCTHIHAKGGWSIAACTVYRPGILYGKPLTQCTDEEIQHELWAQLMRSHALQRYIQHHNGFMLDPSMMVHWTGPWPTFTRDKDTHELHTSEPKFTNNAGTLALRPSYRTDIPHLWVSTAYVKETISIYSMEAAVIAGHYVAADIADDVSLLPTIRDRPRWLEPFRSVDDALYQMNLPGVLPMTLALVVLMVLGYGLYRYRNH